MADQQYVVLNLTALMQGGEVVVGPMSFIEAAMWIGDGEKVGHVILECHDPLTAGIDPDDDIKQACAKVVQMSGGKASDRKIQVIKELRTYRSNNGQFDRSGLKECKDDIDRYFAQNPTI